MAVYGYVRVSSADQNEDRQLLAMGELKIPQAQIFIDKQSGKNFERHHNIRKRQAEGIAAARARGVRFGRPIKKPPENFPALVRQWERGKLTAAEVLERTGLKEATFYNCLREYRAAKDLTTPVTLKATQGLGEELGEQVFPLDVLLQDGASGTQ